MPNLQHVALYLEPEPSCAGAHFQYYPQDPGSCKILNQVGSMVAAGVWPSLTQASRLSPLAATSLPSLLQQLLLQSRARFLSLHCIMFSWKSEEGVVRRMTNVMPEEKKGLFPRALNLWG